MTNFAGCLEEYERRGGKLTEDEGFWLPRRQFLKVSKKSDARIEKLFEGEYTISEEISTYRAFEYRAAIKPAIGMSPKQIKKEVRNTLKNQKINATVSVKTGKVNNDYLYLTITVE